jgi:MFS family permease
MDDVSERALLRKVTLRLIPFLFILYIIAFLDRVNVGFAKLQMNSLPWFSEAVYGMGAGIFFIGYFLFEVPSNLILEKVGARWWIARIMVVWGLIASAMMFTSNPPVFYTLRFLLGAAEAGFFPGIILYLTYWLTADERARIVGLFMTAIPISSIIGGPLSGKLLQMNGLGGLPGWQWLFLLEGIPAVLMGFVVLAYLPDGPAHARWLSPDERDHIKQRLDAEHSAKQDHALFTLRSVMATPTVWQLCLIYFTIAAAGYGITLWLPQITSGFGKLTSFQVGLLTTIPSIAATFSLVINGAHSDRTGERKLHVAFPLFAAMVGLIISAYFPQVPWLALLALSVASMGLTGTLGPFWAMPTAMLSRTAAAAGIALISSMGNLGGFVGPYMVGWIKERTHNYQYGLISLAAMALVGGLVALTLRHATFTRTVRNELAEAGK